MATSIARTFRTALRRFENVADSVSYVDDIKTAARNVEIPNSIGDMFENINYQVIDNRLTGNGVKLHSVEPYLRRGELRKFAQSIRSSAVITSADELAFTRSLGNNIPDLKVRELDENIISARRSNPDLDVVATSGEELYNKLTPTARTKLERAVNIIKSTAITTGTVAGVFAVLTVGEDLYQTIVDATNTRKGCYLVRSLNGETTSCKIYKRSCGNLSNDTSNVCEPQQIPVELGGNVALFLMNAINNNTLSIEIGELLQLSAPLSSLNIQTVLTNPELVDKVIENYEEQIQEESINYCIQVTQIEGGIVPPCRACNPAASVNSTQYIDTSTLADNYTLKCVQDISVLSTLVDLATGVGVKIFDTLGALFPHLRTIAIVIIVIIVLLIIASFAFKKKPVS